MLFLSLCRFDSVLFSLFIPLYSAQLEKPRNLCELCPKHMRRSGYRGYAELAPDIRREVAKASEAERLKRNEAAAEGLRARDQDLAALIAVEVAKRIRKADGQ